MKYGLIGCGRISRNHIIAAKENGLEIVCLCDLNEKKIEQSIVIHDLDADSIKKYGDYRVMLSENPDLELISIATDSGSHATIAFYCIENGVNLIIEKPIAMSIQDADKIIEMATDKGVVVSACHQNRFNLAVQKTRKALEDGRFGRLSHGSINVRWNRNKAYYDQATWRGTWEHDGGTLMNQCIHGIDLLRWFFGDDIDEVYGTTSRQYHDYIEAEDVGLAIVKFKNGAIATIEGTINVFPQNLEETLYIFGEKGTVKIGGKSTNNIDYWKFEDEGAEDEDTAGLKEETNNVYGNGHISLFADVIDAIKVGRKPYVDAVDGRNALELVLAIYKSKKTGLPVKLPLIDFSSTDMEGTF